jgi:hypothetical protein
MVSTGRSPRKTADEVIEQLREVFATNAAGNAQLAARFNEFVRDISKEIGRGERADPSELFSRWLDFNLASYAVLNRQGLALLDGLLTAARSTLIPPAISVPIATQAPRAELRLSGPSGQQVRTGFVIENYFDRPLDIAFACSDLSPGAGPSLPRSLVAFEPATLMIPPRGQAVGQVAVNLTDDFVVGETYIGTIQLQGFEGKELGISVVVLPAADAADPPNPAVAQSRPARRRQGPSK